MIDVKEFRPGNLVLLKTGTRIIQVPVGLEHFEQIRKEGSGNFFPLVLKPELFEKAGFKENKDYPLLPEAREFILVLPVAGSNLNEIRGYVKSNKECFARALVNQLPVSNNVFHFHALQNLYYALVGAELDV